MNVSNQIKGLCALLIMCVLVVFFLFLFTSGEMGGMDIDMEEHPYHILDKVRLEQVIESNFPTGFTLRTIYDEEKSMFVPFSELGISYFSPEQEKYIDFFLTHKTLYKVWKAFPIKKDLEPIRVSPQRLYYNEEDLRKSVIGHTQHFSYVAEDAFLVETDGKIQVIPDKNGFEVDGDGLSDTFIQAIYDGNYESVFVSGNLIFPAIRLTDIASYTKLLTKVSSAKTDDALLQDNLLYVFSSLNNMPVMPGESFSISDEVERRMAVLAQKQLLDVKTTTEIEQIFDRLFDVLKHKGFVIETYNSDMISIGEKETEGNKGCPILKINNNREKPIIFSCYIQDNQLNLLVVTEN